MSTDTAPIGAISFFKGLGTTDLITIMQYTKTEDIEANTTVFHLGDPPNGLYVILKGRLRVYVPGKAGAPQKTLVVLEPGACVGEFGLIDGQPRSASVDTVEMAQLLYLPAPAFEIIVKTNPTVAKNVVSNLCKSVKTQKNIVYACDQDKDRIDREDLPPTLEVMQILSALLRYHNKRVQILGLK
jgi:CRP-like cAMP-binding protein